MKQIFLISFLFLLTCNAGENNKNSYFRDKIDAEILKERNLQTYHLRCVVKKNTLACEILAFLYRDGGLFGLGEKIKPDKQKAKFYNELLCNEYKKEFYCKELELNE